MHLFVTTKTNESDRPTHLQQGATVMSIRFVTRTVHAWLDYPVAASLVATPFIVGVGQTNRLAVWTSVATGIVAFVLTALTDHETGIIRALPFAFHLTIDRLVGVVFAIVPFVFGFSGVDAWYYWANAAAVLLVTTVLNAPESTTSSATPARA
jgi:hypothetical protein